jgi:hypothetical protein
MSDGRSRSPLKPGDSPGYALIGNAERRLFAALIDVSSALPQAQIAVICVPRNLNCYWSY